nr:MAG TPA: hypothetical protein [Bacteriophage sp.]
MLLTTRRCFGTSRPCRRDFLNRIWLIRHHLAGCAG